MEKEKRKVSIDVLRCIAMLLIILAHCGAPTFLDEIRNFDVVLLVILSGTVAVKSYERSGSWFKYIGKRLIRLLVPTFIFLTILFLLEKIVCIFDPVFPLDSNTILTSYELTSGIGYVWIIRIYILCAVAVPILMNIEKYKKTIIVILFIIYEILFYTIGNANGILEYIIYYLIPYGLLCVYIGMRLNDWNNKKILKITTICLLIFVSIFTILYFTKNQITKISDYKYPPRIYFLSYGIGISLLLYYLFERKNIFNVKEKLNNKLILFIGQHTMWIYLWQIFYLNTFAFVKFHVAWYAKFIYLVVASVLTTYIQSKIVQKLNIKNKTIKAIFDS